jgi:zinc transporter
VHPPPRDGRFLSSATGLDKLIAAAMVSEDTRSRLRVHGQGVMVLLKAMHLRADGVGHPEDMVSMRIWIDERRVITTREEDVDPILELAEDISQGRGPATPGDFLAISSKSTSRKFPSRSRCWRMGWI